MKEETDEYERKIAFGEAIEKILHEGEAKEAALSKDKKEALELYRRNVELESEDDKEISEESELESENDNEIEKVIKEEMCDDAANGNFIIHKE